MYVRTGSSFGMSGYRGLGAANPIQRINPNPPDQKYWFDTPAYLRASGADPTMLPFFIDLATKPAVYMGCPGITGENGNPYMDSQGRILYYKSYLGSPVPFNPTDPLNYCPDAYSRIAISTLADVPDRQAGIAAAGGDWPPYWDTDLAAQGTQSSVAHMMDIFPYGVECVNTMCPHSFTGNLVDYTLGLWHDPDTNNYYVGNWKVPFGFMGRLYGDYKDFVAAQQAYMQVSNDIDAISTYGHTTSGKTAPTPVYLPPAIPNTTYPKHYEVTPYMKVPPGMTLAQAAASPTTVMNYAPLFPGSHPIPPASGSPLPVPDSSLPPGTPAQSTTPLIPWSLAPNPAVSAWSPTNPETSAAPGPSGVMTSAPPQSPVSPQQWVSTDPAPTSAAGPYRAAGPTGQSQIMPVGGAYVPSTQSQLMPVGGAAAGLGPVPLASSASGVLDSSMSWIQANPLLAAGIAAGLALMFMGGGRR